MFHNGAGIAIDMSAILEGLSEGQVVPFEMSSGRKHRTGQHSVGGERLSDKAIGSPMHQLTRGHDGAPAGTHRSTRTGTAALIDRLILTRIMIMVDVDVMTSIARDQAAAGLAAADIAMQHRIRSRYIGAGEDSCRHDVAQAQRCSWHAGVRNGAGGTTLAYVSNLVTYTNEVDR